MKKLINNVAENSKDVGFKTYNFMLDVLRPILWLAVLIVFFAAALTGGYAAIVVAPFFLVLALLDAGYRRLRKVRIARQKAAHEKALVKKAAKAVDSKPVAVKLGFFGRMKLKRKVKKAFYNEMARYVELAQEEKQRVSQMAARSAS
jgi:uncharacterized protein (DUF58 family)